MFGLGLLSGDSACRLNDTFSGEVKGPNASAFSLFAVSEGGFGVAVAAGSAGFSDFSFS